MRENSLVQWLQQFDQPRSPELLKGIGDDAAALRPLEPETVVTTDLICDGSHFVASECTPQQIGRKAMAVNLSDIAAMAAIPTAAFISLLLPKTTGHSYATSLMAAAIELANEYDCTVAGGDTNVWEGRLAINVVILGHATARGPLFRSGALPDDILLVTGALGGSLEGHHFEFTPRINEARLLHQRYELHAGMDLSDGLAMDLRRLAEASGCGAEIDADALPISETVKQVSCGPEARTMRALGDGEDFELLLAVPPDEAARILADQPLDIPITKIGRCLADRSLWLTSHQKRTPLPTMGYEHGDNACKSS